MLTTDGAELTQSNMLQYVLGTITAQAVCSFVSPFTLMPNL